jgi:hypothetical protein
LLLITIAAASLAFASTAVAASVTVTPPTGTAVVGHQYCVTATEAGGQAPGTFEFSVTTANGDVIASGAVPQDANGQAQFCFTSTTAGTFTITATARASGVGDRPSGTASVTFVGVPTDKDQCKNGGWQNFGIFKNQGDCVSFFTAGGPPNG